MKTFKSITTVQGIKEPFVDWFTCESESKARELWAAECFACGVPVAKSTVSFTEVNPVTLKPIKN